MQKRTISKGLVLAAAVSSFAPLAAYADLSGFGSFAPVNKGTNAAAVPGYSSDLNTFTLTDGGQGEAVSGYTAVPQDITSFQASFTYTVPGGNGQTSQFAQADGFAFIMQNDSRGSAALGGDGGAWGYGSGNNGGPIVTPSVALGYEMYNGQQLSLSKNAAKTTTSSVGSSGGITALQTGHADQVTVTYTGSTLTESIYDTVTKQAGFVTYKNINLPSLVGGNTAYVGFGGGAGGASSTQTISNFNYKVTAQYAYTPISLASTSFNNDMVIEAGAPASGAAANITATMDTGLTKTGATYYEQGYNTAAPTSGLPASGSTFTSQAGDGRHSFTMQNYTGNNALLLTPTNTTGTMTFNTPTAFSALSFLAAVGNGLSSFSVTVNYADGSPSVVVPYSAVTPDWFFQGPPAFVANGRAYASATGATTYDNVNNSQPNLYQVDVNMPVSSSPISSVTLNYGSTAGNLAIFAVSGAVPEPASMGLVVSAAALLLSRRRARNSSAV